MTRSNIQILYTVLSVCALIAFLIIEASIEGYSIFEVFIMTILFIGEYFWVWLICLIVVITAWVLYKMAAIPSWILRRKNKMEKEKNEADAAAQKAGYRNYAEWEAITREAENLEAREHGYRNYKEWQEAKRLAKEEREDEIQDDRDFEA